MALPIITGEFGVVDLDLQFSQKGSAWLKIRAVAKDRVRDANGAWSDGDPLFINIICNQSAENLFESVVKGDTITVTGKLKQRQYEVNGDKRTEIQIHADILGVSVRWAHAKTQRAIESVGVATVQETLGGEVINESTEAPF
jgi:single-strand DNA-binding protein